MKLIFNTPYIVQSQHVNIFTQKCQVS